jgi:hypothetical protein
VRHTPPHPIIYHLVHLSTIFILFIISTLGVLVANSNPAQAAIGFQNSYDPNNWSFSNTGTNGSVNDNGAPNSIILYGGDTEVLPSSPTPSTTYTITASETGTVSFNWSYTNDDLTESTFDRMGYLFNGTPTQLMSDLTVGSETGTASFNVTQGDTFGFYIETDNFGSASATFSNFDVSNSAAVPFEFSPTLGLIMVGGFWGCRKLRKKAVKSH